MLTAQAFGYAPVRDGAKKRLSRRRERESLWASASIWILLLPLLYFALDGISPFVNGPAAIRSVAISSAGGVLMDRLSSFFVFGVCIFFVFQRGRSVCRMSGQMKLITGFPIIALLLAPLSQQPTRSLSSGMVLLGGILLVYYILSRYTPDEVLELLLVLGTVTIAASIVFALALPMYGRDLTGGHSTAWKGIFSAKNYLGNMALFFLTVAVSYRGRTPFLRSIRLAQIVFCLTAIAFSRAVTAYVLTIIYLGYAATMAILRRFRKKDCLVVCILLVAALSAFAAAFVIWPDFLLTQLGKDPTLTGRTGIWRAVLDSFAKRPLLGYGYQAFWLGFKGESYRVILSVTWLLGQAQNGFLDVMLELGAAGLAITLLIFGFAFRDAAICLFHTDNPARLRAVEWYLAIVILTFLYNLDESFLFEPRHLASMLFVLACVGLRLEWIRLRATRRPTGHAESRWFRIGRAGGEE